MKLSGGGFDLGTGGKVACSNRRAGNPPYEATVFSQEVRQEEGPWVEKSLNLFQVEGIRLSESGVLGAARAYLGSHGVKLLEEVIQTSLNCRKSCTILRRFLGKL